MLVLCSAESHPPLRMTLEHSMLAAAHTALADRFDTPSGSQSSLAVIPRPQPYVTHTNVPA